MKIGFYLPRSYSCSELSRIACGEAGRVRPLWRIWQVSLSLQALTLMRIQNLRKSQRWKEECLLPHRTVCVQCVSNYENLGPDCVSCVAISGVSLLLYSRLPVAPRRDFHSWERKLPPLPLCSLCCVWSQDEVGTVRSWSLIEVSLWTLGQCCSWVGCSEAKQDLAVHFSNFHP